MDMKNTEATKGTKMQTKQMPFASAMVAGSFAAEKRAEGYAVRIESTGSDDKRGTKPTIWVVWTPKP